MTAGEQFVKWIKPAGCVLFLGIFAAFLVICFTAKAPVEGYTVPHDSQYYAQHLDELKAELETNLFPKLEGIEDCYISGGKLKIIISDAGFEKSNKAITHYYGENLFIIEKEAKK